MNTMAQYSQRLGVRCILQLFLKKPSDNRSVANALLIVFLICAMGCDSAQIQTMLDEAQEIPESIISLEDSTSLLSPRTDFGDQGAFWGDFDNNGAPDLMYMGHGNIPALYRQDDGTFIDVVDLSGIQQSNWLYPQQRDRHGGSCADYDNDGVQDIFISHGAMRGETLGVKTDELLRGIGNFTFEDVTHVSGATNTYGRSRTGLWVDINVDGWLDLHVNNFQSKDVVYISNRDGTFREMASELGLNLDTFHAAWSDFNGDGLPDVVTGTPIRLLQNVLGGKFRDVTVDYIGESSVFAIGFAWGDLDGDSDLDLAVSRLGMGALLFENRNTHFSMHEMDLGLDPGVIVTGIAAGDMDNSGTLDLVLNSTEGVLVYKNEGELKFTKAYAVPREIPVERMQNGDIALEDFDGDGLLDIATDDPSGYRLFRNTTQGAGNWLRVKFKGVNNNAMGFGSSITLTDEEGTEIGHREYFGSSAGMLSRGCSLLHFGLNDTDSVDLNVRWPDRSVTKLASISANRTIEVSE